MQKLHNPIMHYTWGSLDAFTKLFCIANPQNQPLAELWMGAHPKASSSLIDENGNTVNLREAIAKDSQSYLGKHVLQRFSELPFLVKILGVAKPLSIQVHPNKKAAQEGFLRENKAAIPLTGSLRNYQDANHKPELVYALTSFKAMCGFRPLNTIHGLLNKVSHAHPIISIFLKDPSALHLEKIFIQLLTLQTQEKIQALNTLKATLQDENTEPWITVKEIAQFFPEDMGLFAPLFLNVITLEPEQALFLPARTPHAYLKGAALEVMANSDNVLRAGLTEKHIDIPELLANIDWHTNIPDILMGEKHNFEQRFPVPVDDFSFSIHLLQTTAEKISQDSPTIIFCLSGKADLRAQQTKITLLPGESCFIAANETPFEISGEGKIARIFTP